MITDDENDDVLAAEYAIGLLDAEACVAARSRANNDPSFAARVIAWEVRLSQMADLPPIEPPISLRKTLLQKVFSSPATVPFWKRTGVWQALTGGAFAALLLLSVGLWQSVSPPQTGPLYTTQIVSDTGDFRVVAVVDMAQDEVLLTRTAGAAPQGRILQVWAHGPDEPAQSVGLWPAGDSIRLPLPPEIAAVTGTLTLGVSEEPPGGSLTGSPSGRVFGTSDIPNVSSAG